MNTLIVGYGSIGARHARILSELGHAVSVVSRHADSASDRLAFELHRNLETVAVNDFDYIIIANRSSEHFDSLNLLSQKGFDGLLLIEKPLFEKPYPIPANLKANSFVAYNLRFHPLLQRLRSLLAGQRLIAVQARVGQYLPDWRPGSDYRTHYSAKRSEGGGVLSDLSHELDYLTWLIGDWQNLTARGGKWSDLEIDSDDFFTLLWDTERCPVVSLTMNYLDTSLRREFIINTAQQTIKVDFVTNQLWVDSELEFFSCERDETYIRQHEAILSGKSETACTLQEGLDLLNMIEAASMAAADYRWVKRNQTEAQGLEI